MKSNICVIAVDKRYSRTVAKLLSRALSTNYADINRLIEYELMDVDEVVRLCGEEYLRKLEYSKVKNVSSFENTLFTLDCELLGRDGHCDVVKKNALLIFLSMSKASYCAKLKNQKLGKNDKQNQIDVFDDRNALFGEMADIVVECDGLDAGKVVKKIKNSIVEYFDKGGKNE